MRLDLCHVCRSELSFGSAQAMAGFDLACTPFQYEYPVDHFVRALKFRGERAFARVLGVLLADARRTRPGPLPALVVPIPLHVARYRRRGFNQAREIARFAAKELGLPVAPQALERVIPTAEQSGLGIEDRRSNVRGAFCIGALPQGVAHVALVDDVVTTGSTAGEAAAVLRRAGVGVVELWAPARAIWQPDERAL